MLKIIKYSIVPCWHNQEEKPLNEFFSMGLPGLFLIIFVLFKQFSELKLQTLVEFELGLME